jgi:hypothetical protein
MKYRARIPIRDYCATQMPVTDPGHPSFPEDADGHRVRARVARAARRKDDEEDRRPHPADRTSDDPSSCKDF